MTRNAPISAVLLLGACAACGASASPAPEPLALTTLVDVNPDPEVVEVNLVAVPASAELLAGKRADIWAYRDASIEGSLATTPGPLLDVRQGNHVIVHFSNQLPEATTIHWHGLRVPNASDGTPASQLPIEPGATFDYVFDVPDAGTFWYHPHVDSDTQIERGLYAPIVVRGGVEPEVAADRVFVLDDVKLEATGQLSSQTGQLDLMLGRQGNVLLVNGHSKAALEASSGSRERWRFVNAANGRYFNLALEGHTLLVIGWDGGLLVEPYTTDTLLIAPGERYEVLVELRGARGGTIALQTLHYDRGHDIPDPGPLDLFTVELTAEASSPPPPLPTSWGSFEALPLAPGTPIRRFVLTEEEKGLVEPRFFINGERYPDVTPTLATQGDVEIWEIQNDAEMDHPFHLHGMFFQVLDVAGTAPLRQGWKDTVNVARKTTLRFAVRYGDPGTWMYHCHILEHAERGMMGHLHVTASP